MQKIENTQLFRFLSTTKVLSKYKVIWTKNKTWLSSTVQYCTVQYMQTLLSHFHRTLLCKDLVVCKTLLCRQYCSRAGRRALSQSLTNSLSLFSTREKLYGTDIVQQRSGTVARIRAPHSTVQYEKTHYSMLHSVILYCTSTSLLESREKVTKASFLVSYNLSTYTQINLLHPRSTFHCCGKAVLSDNQSWSLSDLHFSS